MCILVFIGKLFGTPQLNFAILAHYASFLKIMGKFKTFRHQQILVVL